MPIKKGKDLGITWQCSECGKWNFVDAQYCWSCHEPKLPEETNSKPKRGRPKKELANAS